MNIIALRMQVMGLNDTQDVWNLVDDGIRPILREPKAILALGEHGKARRLTSGDTGHGVLDAAAFGCIEIKLLDSVEIDGRVGLALMKVLAAYNKLELIRKIARFKNG